MFYQTFEITSDYLLINRSLPFSKAKWDFKKFCFIVSINGKEVSCLFLNCLFENGHSRGALKGFKLEEKLLESILYKKVYL